MSRVLIILSFLGVAMGELPEIIVNNVILRNTHTFFYEGNKSISTDSLYLPSSKHYPMAITCVNKYSAKCEMMYNVKNVLVKDNTGDAKLSLTVTTNKISFNIAASYQDQLIYYEYEDDENLTMTCSVWVQNSKDGDFFKLVFEGDSGGYNKPITITKQLISSDNNRTLECVLSNNKRQCRRITLLFQKVTLTSSTASSVVDDMSHKIQMYEIIIIVLVLFCCFLILISIVVCRKRKSNILAQNKFTGDSSIQQPSTNISQSEKHYSDPAIEKSECLYSNPCDSEKTPELNYAVLDISRSLNVLPKNDTVLYSEIRHNVA